jgi:hypothetical protein
MSRNVYMLFVPLLNISFTCFCFCILCTFLYDLKHIVKGAKTRRQNAAPRPRVTDIIGFVYFELLNFEPASSVPCSSLFPAYAK